MGMAAAVRTVYNWFQNFSLETSERELVESGLVLKSLYSDVVGSPYSPTSREFAVVAGKAK
jgi:hypothetical protein